MKLIQIYQKLEKVIRWLNKTILRGYNEYRWDKLTKPTGVIIDYEHYDADYWYYSDEESKSIRGENEK